MGIDKQGSKGGNYVGGFLQMFDWNAKSRKKLFSSKSDVPEQSKQKKRCDGNMPMTRLNLLDADENAAGSSVKGSSDYSCSSSLVDEDFSGPKVPGVVARLMGLDSLPKSTIPESYSAPLFDHHSLRDSYYRSKNLEYSQDRSFQTSQKVINRPIEKFQTEILPPRSAKSIPVTHHKLLSPIKSCNFVHSKNAAQIMEAAARIIDPGPQERPKKKPPTVGSSSVPLRVHDLKEKVQASQKVSKVLEGSQRKSVKKGPVDAKPSKVLQDSEESSKSKGKSISLALQAKANVQKRESLNAGSSRNVVGRKEPNELSPGHTRKSMIKKTPVQNGSSALRQNNQKQNCVVDRGKPRGKMVNGESSSRQRNSRKLTSDNKREAERVTCKKRSVDGNYHMVKNQAAVKREMNNNGKANDFYFQDSGRTGTDVVSFTFTAPMTRSGPSSMGETSAPRFPYIGHNVKGGDALSILLEQKLKELAQKVEFSQQKLGMHSPGLGPTSSSSMVEDNQGVLEETSTSGSTSTASQTRKLLDHRLPSPVSVLEHSPSAESCNSSDSAESNSTSGSKQCSSIQAQEVLDPYSSNAFLGFERDADLSDSASSITAKRRQTTTFVFTNSKNPQRCELEYVKKMVHNVEPMFKDYALGISKNVISPLLFDQLQRSKDEAFRQRILFDCVDECLELKCRRYVNGGYTLWAKGSSTVRKKERLAEEIYKEITGWSLSIGEDKIDELVDKDMSCQYGRWVDFDVESFEIGTQIESKILSALIDEVVDDILAGSSGTSILLLTMFRDFVDISNFLRYFVEIIGIHIKTSPFIFRRNNTEQMERWTLPPNTWYKLNVDGSAWLTQRKGSYGELLRDEKGNWIWGFSDVRNDPSVDEVELYAIHKGLEIAWDKKIPKIIETDSESIFIGSQEMKEAIRHYNLLLRNAEVNYVYVGLLR